MPDLKPDQSISRRELLRLAGFVPVLFVPAPMQGLAFQSKAPQFRLPGRMRYADFRIQPHYPASSSVDQMVRLVSPGTDQFVMERYARELEQVLKSWTGDNGIAALDASVDTTLHASSFRDPVERSLRDQYGLSVIRKTFKTILALDRRSFLEELQSYFGSLHSIRVAELEITSILPISESPLRVRTEIRYTFVGENQRREPEQRIGKWQAKWQKFSDQWRLTEFEHRDEAVCTSAEKCFVDCSAQAFGSIPSYQQQLSHGADYWRTLLDGAVGVDVYGNQGIAVGDFNGDGYDDIYICQPAGLPNRLYRNRGDGTFEDVSEQAGVNVLDSTSCALFADFENLGRQDLLVVTSGGPLLFVNQGNGTFSLKANAFQFAQPPQGTFTHAALADYDRDGRLDVYFCVYNYYAGLDQYRYPSPYFDARNGPPNFLFHNEGRWTFSDRTESAGLKIDNDRYSFACAWGDHNGNGLPDLYVANDFGRNNLYLNNGDGTFTSAAHEAHAEDVGAGMSACWLDFNGDGKQDIYVANMWSAAGLRVSNQENFHKNDPEDVRALYRRHARGNSLYQNLGDGKFKNVAEEANCEFGRWAWSSDSFDFDHDGFPDLFISNGYVSGAERADAASFFWRQVVGNSPRDLSPASDYEHAWNAINELIRSDYSWSGYERNVLYANNQDGSFSDLSGISGLDLIDDSRAFALSDLDHDGRLEILLKNRNAPQVRLLRNAMKKIGNSISFRLRGTKSNRDAIGAAVTLEAQGYHQTKYLQAGSGFLSQHTKQVIFGVGDTKELLRATVRWPSGLLQIFDHLPVNHSIELTEGSTDFQRESFSAMVAPSTRPPDTRSIETLPIQVATWLLQPLVAPSVSLSDTSGKLWHLGDSSRSTLLLFWASDSDLSLRQLRELRDHKRLATKLSVLAVNVDDSRNREKLLAFSVKEQLWFPVLSPTEETVGIYNIVYRYLFDRHRDMDLPTSFLLDETGKIVKVYRGSFKSEDMLADIDSIPRTPEERIKKALPYSGTLHLGAFQRNDFTYGVAFFQRGYLEAAADAFLQVIADKPDDPEAHYNLGTLYLQRNDLAKARAQLERTVELKPEHPQAWNNLGMLAAEEGKTDEASENFKRSLALHPDYDVALLNLGNIYRRQHQFPQAEQLLRRALEIAPDNPEANYSIAMLYAQEDQPERAEQNFQRALSLRPGYQDALNNFGVLLVREKRYSDAEKEFQSCIQNNPNFDQAYLNLARLYLVWNNKDKARDTLEVLLQKQPQHEIARQMLKMLQ